MIITNRTNLPQSFLNLVEASGYVAKGDTSTTRLIKPPRIVVLSDRYKDQIEVDVQEMAWSVLGQTAHVALERTAGQGVIVERRLHAMIQGWDVNGQPDAYYPETRLIDDYKITSVWAFMHTAKPEWEAQCNLNAMLHRINNQEVDETRIVAFLRDWQRKKAEFDLRYPQNPIHVVGQVVWPQQKAYEYALERIKLHKRCRELHDEDLPLCTPQERWYRSGGFAVLKNGNKKADRVFDRKPDAEEFIKTQIPKLKPKRYFLPIEERPGENIRCLYYCEARTVCPFGKSLVDEKARGGEARASEPEDDFQGPEE